MKQRAKTWKISAVVILLLIVLVAVPVGLHMNKVANQRTREIDFIKKYEPAISKSIMSTETDPVKTVKYDWKTFKVTHDYLFEKPFYRIYVRTVDASGKTLDGFTVNIQPDNVDDPTKIENVQ